MIFWVQAILYTFIRSYTLLYDSRHFYVISVDSHTVLNILIRSPVKHLYLFLTHSNFTNSKHLKIYQPVLNYHKNMRSLSVHPNLFKTNFYFFFIQYKKRKMPSPSTKEKKAKFNTDDLIYLKKFSLPSETLLSLSSYVDIERSSAECNSTASLTNKYKFFGTKSKQTVFQTYQKKLFL